MKPGSIIFNWRQKGNLWNGTILNLPERERLKNFVTADKVIITVFWNCEGMIFVNVMLGGETVNSDASIRTLPELWKRFVRVWPCENLAKMVLQLDNARLQTSLKTWEDVTKFGWKCYSIHPAALI